MRRHLHDTAKFDPADISDWLGRSEGRFFSAVRLATRAGQDISHGSDINAPCSVRLVRENAGPKNSPALCLP